MEANGDLSVVEKALARLAILEDVGDEDLTAAVVPKESRSIGVIRAKEPGILSGLGVAVQVFRIVDETIEIEPCRLDGDRFEIGNEILRATGGTRGLLTAERSALNFLQHLSGIATRTARFVEAVAVSGSGVRITDTRKTVPGLRLLEKEAVVHGGGVNHRLGLYDAVMIKDNHVDAAGGIAAAVEAARASAPAVPIIVEARSLDEAETAARLGVGRILLDNMEPDQVAASVRLIRAIAAKLPEPKEEEESWRWLPGSWRPGDSPIQIEVSGGISLETAVRYALPGVDFLAVGDLTHSAPAVDLSMDLESPASTA
jgi:nicotinate-nucleotide pyrophosphorylase (carboxylating)